MNTTAFDTVVNAVPMAENDVSRPERYANDIWHPWFARLRKETPVHFLADSVNGPFWSVSTHDLIKEVDTNNTVFSSSAEFGGIAITTEQLYPGHQFIRGIKDVPVRLHPV